MCVYVRHETSFKISLNQNKEFIFVHTFYVEKYLINYKLVHRYDMKGGQKKRCSFYTYLQGQIFNKN